MREPEDGVRARIRERRARLDLVLRVARRQLDSPRGGYRQAEMLALAAVGLSDSEIACVLKTSPETVGTHWQRLLQRLGAKTRTEAVAILMEREFGSNPGEGNGQ